MSTHNNVIVVEVENMKQASKFPNGKSSGITSYDIQLADLVILKTPTHFRPYKCRWQSSEKSEKIPNYLLTAYLGLCVQGPLNMARHVFWTKI